MKTARTYVFMFVPILFEPVAHTRIPIGSNGSAQVRSTVKRHGAGCQYRDECNTQTLPSHLFWTWFVDNPRRNLR